MVVHGQSIWQGHFVSVKYQDHSAWDTEVLHDLLQVFFNLSAAKSFPTLEEFDWRADKVRLTCESTAADSVRPVVIDVFWIAVI